MAAASVRRLCRSPLFSTRCLGAMSTSSCSTSKLPTLLPRPHFVAFHRTVISWKRNYCSESAFNEPGSGYKYTKDHEWVSTGGEGGSVTVGISNYAQEKLGDVVFVELPEVGAEFEKGDIFGVLESVKAAADVHSPVAGTVAEVNEKLSASPELVNKEPYNDGWLMKLKDVPSDDFVDLMDSEGYKTFLEESA